MESFQVDILATDHTFYSGPCASLVVPTPHGMYGVMARHSNMIASVAPGELKYTLPGEAPRIAAVSSGLIKVEDGRALILVETAERPEEIDRNRAQRTADAAREAMLQKMSRREYLQTQAQLARTIIRLRVKSHAERLD